MTDRAAPTRDEGLDLEKARALPLLIVASMQGVVLYALHRAIEGHTWPATDPPALITLYALTIFVSVALLLSPRDWEHPAWRGGITVTAVIIFGCAWHIATNGDIPGASYEMWAPFAVGFFLFWFIALPFSQALAQPRRAGAQQESGHVIKTSFRVFDYPTLFDLGWQNCLRLVEGGIFLGLLWALLLLGAGLFKLIHLDLPNQLITKPVFVYPVSAVCFGFALYLLHSRNNIVRVLRRHLLAIFQWLLPLAVLVAAGFLVALAFTGMESLWSTRHSAFLVGVMSIFLIVLYNAAYGDGVEPPAYPSWLASALRWGVLALPPLAAIGLYALALRIGQHGLSVDRIIALAAHCVLALYGLGYLAAAVMPGRWLGAIGSINIAMAMVVVSLMALLASPVLDPMRLTVESQLARLGRGETSASTFDYDYFRFHLGKYGIEALRRLASDTTRPDGVPSLAQAALARDRESAVANAIVGWENRLAIYPASKTLDPSFVSYANDREGLQKHRVPDCLRRVADCTIVQADLDGDGRDEVIFIQSPRAPIYSRSRDPVVGETPPVDARPAGWHVVGDLRLGAQDSQHFDQVAAEGGITVQASPWNNLLVGKKLLPFSPNLP